MAIIKSPERLNHDRMLQTFGDVATDKYADFVSDSRYNFGASDFWISVMFLDYPATDNGFIFQFFKSPNNVVLKRNPSTQSIELNASSAQTTNSGLVISSKSVYGLKHGLIRRVSDKVELFVNGEKLGERTIGATDTFDFSATTLPIGNRIALTEGLNGAINNFVVGLGTISIDDIRSIHGYIGYIPLTLHDQVLNHWAFTQQSYYKDGADVKVWDCVEQYNHAKVTPLTPIHATLKNFTDSEVGADATVNPASVIDVYTKATYTDPLNVPVMKEAFHFSRAEWISVQNFSPTGEKGYTYIIAFAADNANFLAGQEGFLYKRDAGYTNVKAFLGSPSTKNVSVFNDPNGLSIMFNSDITKLRWLCATEKPDLRKGFDHAYPVAQDTPPTIKAWSDIVGVNTDELRIGSLDSAGTNGLSGKIAFVGIWKGVLTNKEIAKVINNGLGNYTKIVQEADCQLYLLPNTDQISNDATNIVIQDHSPQIQYCILEGLTGATLPDKLTDAQGKGININTLR